MLDLGRVFNAPKWKIFAKIRIPNALPYILSALKITATAAVVGAIVGEFVASQKRPGLRHRHHAEQHEHLRGVRRADLDLGRRPCCCTASSCCWRTCGRRGPKDRSIKGRKWTMNRTLSLGARRAARRVRQRLGAGEIHLRAELVRRRRPRRLLGGARQGLLQGQGPRRDARELQGLGRLDRQGRYRPRRRGPRRCRRRDRLRRARHHGQDRRHGVRQDAAQHLQPQEQAAQQAQGPRRRHARRAAGRQPAPDVPGLRQG